MRFELFSSIQLFTSLSWTHPFDGNGRTRTNVAQTIFENKIVQMVSNPFTHCFCFRKSSEEQNEWDLWQKTEDYSEYDSSLVTLFTKTTCCMVHVAILYDNVCARISKDSVIWSKWVTISNTKTAPHVALTVWKGSVWCYYFGLNKKLFYCNSPNGEKWSKPEEVKLTHFNMAFEPKTTLLHSFEFREELILVMVRDDGVYILSTADGKTHETIFSYPTRETDKRLDTVCFNDVLYQSMVRIDGEICTRRSSDARKWTEWLPASFKAKSQSSFSVFKGKLIHSVHGLDDEIYIRYTEDGNHWTKWTVCGDDRRKTNLPVSFITKSGSPYLYQTIVSLDNFVITRKISCDPTTDTKFMIDNTYASNTTRDASYFKDLMKNYNYVDIKSIGNETADLVKALKENKELKYIDFSYSNATNRNVDDICQVLSSHPKLAKLSFRGNQICEYIPSLSELLGSVKTLVEIDLSDNRIGDDGCKELLQSLTNLSRSNKLSLKKIDLSGNGIERGGSHALKDLILSSVQLECIIFNNNDIQNEGCIHIAEGLADCKSISHFELVHNGISMEGVKAIGKMLSSNTSLKSFTFSHQNAKRIEGIKFLCQGIQSNKNIKELNLSNNKIGSEGTSMIVETLIHNKSLVSLDLSSNDVEDEGLLLLAKSMKENVSLNILKLHHNDFRRIGTTSIASAIAYSKLSKVDLSHCSLSQGGIKALCLTLKADTHLEELYLNYCRLGDLDAQEISVAMAENKTLRVLEMDGNSFEAQGLISISELISSNPGLNHLSVHGSTILGLLAKGFANALNSNSNLKSLSIQIGCTNAGLSEVKEIMQALEPKTNLEKLVLKLVLGKHRLSPVISLLEANPSIKHLGIIDSEVQDKDVMNIAKFLEENTTLEVLNLSRNKIGTEGAIALAMALDKNFTLTSLNLDENDIGFDPINAFSLTMQRNKALKEIILDQKYAYQIDVSYNIVQ